MGRELKKSQGARGRCRPNLGQRNYPTVIPVCLVIAKAYKIFSLSHHLQTVKVVLLGLLFLERMLHGFKVIDYFLQSESNRTEDLDG